MTSTAVDVVFAFVLSASSLVDDAGFLLSSTTVDDGSTSFDVDRFSSSTVVDESTSFDVDCFFSSTVVDEITSAADVFALSSTFVDDFLVLALSSFLDDARLGFG